MDLLGISVELAPVLEHVGSPVPVLVGIFREQVLAIVHEGCLDIDGDPEGIRGSAHRGTIGFPGVLVDLRIAFEALDRDRGDVLSVDVLHEGVVGLVEDVRPIAIGAVVLEVGILVHVRVDRDDAVFLVFLVEAVEELFEITLLDRGVVLEDAEDRPPLELAVELRVDAALPFLVLGRSAGSEGEDGAQE